MIDYSDLQDILRNIKSLFSVYTEIVDEATKEHDAVKSIKSQMHDCKIPGNSNSRDSDIKEYVEKLGSIERDFEESKKLNGELEEVAEDQKELIT